MLRRPGDSEWQDAVAYQVFVRSFRDGNGDRVGDFQGLTEALEVLEALGVTALWLNPVVRSPSYHNYFATDFLDTDPEYGSLEGFAALCRSAHGRGMRLLLDMETQYVSRRHPWFQDADGNPGSRFGSRFLFRGPKHSDPVHLSLAFDPLKQEHVVHVPDAVTLNLDDPDVQALQERVYAFWLDPLGTGDRRSGVDGYRLDHVMDDLDLQGVLTGLYRRFWRGLVESTKRLEPDLFYLAEPADWRSYGADLLDETDMDGVFAMPLMFALRTLDKAVIVAEIERTLAALPAGKLLFTLLENHDVSRFATAVGGEPGLSRAGAGLLLTLPGVPTLYYGQEIGMVGEVGIAPRDWHLPAREAYKWVADVDAPGMATWYRGRPFWRQSALTRPDPPSHEAQIADIGSLWHLYRRLIALRRAHVALRRGVFVEVPCDSEDVLVFLRRYDDGETAETALVALNLSSAPVRVTLDTIAAGIGGKTAWIGLFDDPGGVSPAGTELPRTLSLAPYAIRVAALAPRGAGKAYA